MDYVKSGIGGEKGDAVLRVTDSRPIWQLVPLPLNQLKPTSGGRPSVRTSAKHSLQSLCIDRISRDFHLFTPQSFEGIPAWLTARVVNRLRLDREYHVPSERDTCPQVTSNPDEATIWAISLLADPEGAVPTHILALPQATLLAHLTPNHNLSNPIHPFIEIPRLYATLQPSACTLVTTLKLSGLDNQVDDQTIMPLKWATHLTVLWMEGCTRITDAGVRLLASAIELPVKADGSGIDAKSKGGAQGRGLCNLRAWFLPECRGVTDKSMRSFARWPGLILLDVRDTSCTSSGIEIFNRSSQAYFDCRNADMQPCTPGLRELFARKAAPSTIVHRLSKTLMPMEEYRDLHIIPSPYPFQDRHRPPGTIPTRISNPSSYTRAERVSYHSELGQIYGSGVSSIRDEVREFRSDLKTALFMQNVEDGLVKLPPRSPPGKRRFWDYKPTQKEERARKRKLKGYKDTAAQAAERSKKFAIGTRLAEGEGDGEAVTDSKEFMLVRMVCEEWERLEWSRKPATPISITFTSTQGNSFAPHGKRSADLVGDILGAVSVKRSQDAYGSLPLQGNFPSSPPPYQKSLPDTLGCSQPFNPFKSRPASTSSYGVKPLTFSGQGRLSSQSPLTQSQKADGFDSLSFAPSKQRFGGTAQSEDPKRRGMKMFSGPRK